METTIAERNNKVVDMSADIERFAELGILATLLADRSTGCNIIWASNVFSDKGESYAPDDEIFIRDITGDNEGIIRTRASKDRDDQATLTKAHAEVFTPFWVVRKMVDWADEAWYEAHEPHPSLWQRYVRSPRLEITCGEAPYLVTRYDAADGTRIPVYRRCGVLDRKLIQVTEHVRSRRSWVRHALAALRSTYGYEYQGDNLLIARVNVLATMEDFLDTAGWDPYTPEEYQKIAEVISWNLWQMDGLKDCVPNGALGVEEAEMRLPGFDELFGTDGGQMEIGIARGRGAAKIFDWQNGLEVDFQTLKQEVTLMDNEPRIKFDSMDCRRDREAISTVFASAGQGLSAPFPGTRRLRGA
jgi:type II restriction enzyme